MEVRSLARKKAARGKVVPLASSLVSLLSLPRTPTMWRGWVRSDSPVLRIQASLKGTFLLAWRPAG